MLTPIFEWFENKINPYPEAVPRVPPKNFFLFVLSGLQGLKGYIVILIILTIITGIFDALLFQFIGNIVDWMQTYKPAQLWEEKSAWILFMLFFIVISPVIVGLQAIFRRQALQGVFPMRLRWNYHRLMLGQSLRFYQDEFSGRIASKVMQTSLAVRDVVMTLSDMMVYVFVYLLTSGAILMHFDAWLLVPFFAWFAVFVFSLFWFVPRLSKASRAQADARSLMTGRITDAYANIQTVKLFSYHHRESAYAKAAMQELLVTVHKQMRLITQIDIVHHSMIMLLLGGLSGMGLWLWSQGVVGVGAMAAATAIALRIQGLSRWILWEAAGLFENVGVVQDGMNTLTRPSAIIDAVDAKKLEVSQGAVEFKHVYFAYHHDKPLFDDFNLSIHAGEKIGLVGRSGAGKSTLTNLLLRFYDINKGQIIIDGQDIKGVTQESLRHHIGVVTQDTSLLHRSIRENILYGRPDASEDMVLDAVRRAEAAEFIPDLIDAKGRRGFDAYVGERGVKLSGGQRQRIAIARVMLKDAPILILDEATSALDSEVESAIQQSLSTLMHGKTVIAIAHRLSTIAAMDRLVVMDNGKIVEQGSHRELLALQGVYANLWAHQSGGFLVVS